MFGVSVIIFDFVVIGYGVQWNNFVKLVIVDDNFLLLDFMFMLFGFSGVYLVIMWYVDGVFLGEYGVLLLWYFLLLVRIIILILIILRDRNFSFYFLRKIVYKNCIFVFQKNYWCGMIWKLLVKSDIGKLDFKYFERDLNVLFIGISINYF